MFWRILLAHVLGDYPLQPEWIVFNKRKAWGLGVHIAIHLGLMFILVGPARTEIWPQLLALAGIHLLLDVTKSFINSARASRTIPFYLLDQLLHIISIYLVANWIDGGLDPALLPASSGWPLLAAGYIIATYVWFITERMMYADDSQYLVELEDHFWSRMIGRGVMLTALLLVSPGWIGLGLGMAIQLPYTKGSYRRRALTIDMVVAGVTGILINTLL